MLLFAATWRNGVLFGQFTFAWGEPVYIWLMLFSIFINYLYGLLLARYEKQRVAKIFCSAAAVNIACFVSLNMLTCYKALFRS